MNKNLFIRQLFDVNSSTYTYLLADKKTKNALLIDPVLEQTRRDLKLLDQLGFKLRYTIETHIHADHVTGAQRLKEATGCQSVVPALSHAEHAQMYLDDNDLFEMDNVHFKAWHTPGHTDHHMVYRMDTCVFTGDCLMINACGRTDFQGGDAAKLYHSVQNILFQWPDETVMYPAHDYHGLTVSTLGEQKAHNPRFINQTQESFIQMMQNLNLAYPKRMLQAVPKNMLCANQSKLIDQLSQVINHESEVLNIGQDVVYDTLEVAKHLDFQSWQIATLSVHQKAMQKIVDEWQLPHVLPVQSLIGYDAWCLDRDVDVIYAERLFDEIEPDQCKALISEIRKHLKSGGVFCLYALFQQSKSPLSKQLQDLLKAKHPKYGLRDFATVQNLFESQGFELQKIIDLELGFQLITWKV